MNNRNPLCDFQHSNKSFLGKEKLEVMPRTSDYVKQRVITLYKQGLHFSKIARELKETEGITIYRCTISKLVKKFKQYGTMADKPIPGRKSKVLIEHFNFIDQKMEENDELTSPGKYCYKTNAYNYPNPE